MADIVIVTLFCISVGTALAWCCGRCAMPGGHCLNRSRVVPDLAAVSPGTGLGGLGSSGRLAPVSRFHSSVPFSHSSPSLIGLLASVSGR